MSDSLILTIVAATAAVLAAAICSGLNIAIMAVDLGEVKRKAKLGDRAAKLVLPLRKQIHLTLSSILFTNVAAASAVALVLESRFGGLIAGVSATLLLVIFGEVMPQAMFGKDALKWSARFAPLLWFMRYLTYPLSKPLSMLLDAMFPHVGNKLQTRDELGLMITEHLVDNNSELDEDEVEIIRGALQLSEKRVSDIVTSIRHTYWLTLDTPLNDKVIGEIKERGFSRIPIFNNKLSKCYGVLLVKDLVDIDFDEENLLVEDIALHPVQLVGSKTALDTMFRKFIKSRTHLIPIEKDDRIIGVVTIEDLIEEILGHEIEDEKDRIKIKRNKKKKKS